MTLYGPEKFTGLSSNGPQGSHPRDRLNKSIRVIRPQASTKLHKQPNESLLFSNQDLKTTLEPPMLKIKLLILYFWIF